MESITVFRARDGRRFDSEVKCAVYELLLTKIDYAEELMPGVKIKHGKYLAVDPATLREYKARVWDLVLDEFGEQWPGWKALKLDEVNPFGIMGRVLDDGNSALYVPWTKLMCCDFDLGRVYDQPYYVTHPDKAVLQGAE